MEGEDDWRARVSQLDRQHEVLFERLSTVFRLPVPRLKEIFLDSSDDDFEALRSSLVCGSALDNKNHASTNVDDDCSGTDDGRGSFMQYVRPSLPDALPLDHPRRAEYVKSLVDILLYALANHDSALVDNIVQECPEIVAGLKHQDLSLLLFSLQTYNALLAALKEGVDTNTFDKYGSTLLHKYVLEKDIEFIKLLLKYNADCNIEDRMNQRSAVQLAALQGDFEALYTMVTASNVPVKIDKPDFDGNSLLHLVLQSEHPNVQYKSIVMFLLDRGLSPGAKNLYGETPIHYFCVNRSLCSITFIEPLFEVLVEALLAKNQQDDSTNAVDLRDNDQCTPLIIACAHREWELCKILLRHGADMNIPCSMSSRLLTRGSDTRRGVEISNFKESDCTTGDLMPRSVRQKMFPYICTAQSLIELDSRDRCMNCASLFPSGSSGFSMFLSEPKVHCLNCGRVVCEECIVQSDLQHEILPDYLQDRNETHDDIRVCLVCHPILSKDIKIAKFW